MRYPPTVTPVLRTTLQSLQSLDNITNITTALPTNSTVEYDEMVFTDSWWVRIGVNIVIFFISAVANIVVLVTLLLSRRRKLRVTRVNMLILHLITADLLITFLNIPLDIIWHLTVVWYAGNAMCKLLLFLAQFFMTSSAFLLIVISLDRYAAIVHPLSVNQADKRCKIMLRVAWATAFIFNLPQLYINETMSRPEDPSFVQCTNMNFIMNHYTSSVVWHAFVTMNTYFFPLSVIITCYSVIVYTIYSKGKKFCETKHGGMELRKSGSDSIPKARVRALQMTAILVSAFIICWTPYFVLSTVYTITEELELSALAAGIWEFALALGYANAGVDPIVYGMFTINFSREFQRCCARGRRRPGDQRLYWRGQSQSTTNQVMSTRLGMTSLSQPEGTSHLEYPDGKQTSFIYNKIGTKHDKCI